MVFCFSFPHPPLPSVLICFCSFSSSFFVIVLVRIHNWVSRSRLPTSLFEHSWMGQATHQRRGPHSVRSLCSLTHSGRASSACVSSPRDWAVSVGSHAAGHGFPFCRFHVSAHQLFRVRLLTQNQKNIDDSLLWDTPVLGACCNLRFQPLRAPTRHYTKFAADSVC